MITLLIKLAERGLLPDALIRYGIKRLCAKRLADVTGTSEGEMEKEHAEWIDILKNSPIALVPEKANEQHYEVPPKLFELVLGKRLKYSSGLWQEGSIFARPVGICNAGADIRESRIGGWPRYIRAGMWLGFFNSLYGGAFS